MNNLSIIIPWSNRPEIEWTLSKNMNLFSEISAEIIIVNCGGDIEKLIIIKNKLKYQQLKIVHLPNQIHYNQSLAFNLGVYNATLENLFFTNADIIIEENFLLDACSLLNNKCYITVDKVQESKKSLVPKNNEDMNKTVVSNIIRINLSGGKEFDVESNRVHLSDLTRGGPGLILLKKKDFLSIGGMNSALVGWGWEDIDLLFRLTIFLGMKREFLGKVVHLSHDDSSRYILYDNKFQNEQVNYFQCLNNYKNGNFFGTYDIDIKSFISEQK